MNFVKIVFRVLFLTPIIAATVVREHLRDKKAAGQLDTVMVGISILLSLIIFVIWITAWWYAIGVLWVYLPEVTSFLNWFGRLWFVPVTTLILSVTSLIVVYQKYKAHEIEMERLELKLRLKEADNDILCRRLADKDRIANHLSNQIRENDKTYADVCTALEAIRQWAKDSKSVSRSKVAERMRGMIELVQEEHRFGMYSPENQKVYLLVWLDRFKKKLEVNNKVN